MSIAEPCDVCHRQSCICSKPKGSGARAAKRRERTESFLKQNVRAELNLPEGGRAYAVTPEAVAELIESVEAEVVSRERWWFVTPEEQLLPGGWHVVPLDKWLAHDRELARGDVDWAHLYVGVFPAGAPFVLLKSKPLAEGRDR